MARVLAGFYNDLIAVSRFEGCPLKGIAPPYLKVLPVHVDRFVRFVVVTSAGGGTGSGCFIDFGFLLRKLQADGNWTGVYQFGHVALARDESAGDTLNQVRNSAALLTELDYYYEGTKTYEADYLNLSPSHFADRNPPYDITYVVAATQQSVPLNGDREQAFDQLLWKMVEFLLTDAVATYPDTAQRVVLPRSGPLGAQAFMGDMGLNPKGLSTYGVACREWPAAMVHRQLYGTIIHTIAQSWGLPQEPVGTFTEKLQNLLGIPDATVQANKTVRNKEKDRLLRELLEPVNDLDPYQQLNQFWNDARNAKGKIVPSKLAEVQAKLKRQFEDWKGEPAANQPGVVRAIVQTNLKRLLDHRNETSLPRQVADRLLNLCCQTEAGPATAAQVAFLLGEAVRTEQDFIAECLEGLNPGHLETPTKLEQCWQYANDRLLQEVLQAKQKLYWEMALWLNKLHVRLNHFAKYVQQWAQNIPAAEEAQFITRAPSIVCPLSELERLRQAAIQEVTVELDVLEEDFEDDHGVTRQGLLSELRNLVAQGLPEKDEKGTPTLFAMGPPSYQGATDFSYLHKVEQKFSIGSPRDPPTPMLWESWPY